MSCPWASATWDEDAQAAYIEAHGIGRAFLEARRGCCYVRLPTVLPPHIETIQQVHIGPGVSSLLAIRRQSIIRHLTALAQFGFSVSAVLSRSDALAMSAAFGFNVSAAVQRVRNLGPIAPSFGFSVAASLIQQRNLVTAAAFGFSMASSLSRIRQLTNSEAFGFSVAATLSAVSSADALSIFSTDLSAWYKADVGVTLSGSLVTAWADQSGHSVTVSAGAANPTFAATGFNGKPTIQFDPTAGASGNLLASSAAALTMGSNSHSLFAVVNLRSLGHANDAWMFAFLRGVGGGAPWDNTASCVWMSLDRTSNKLKFTSNSLDFAASTVATSTLYRLAVINDGTNCTMYINNVQAAQTARNTTLSATGQVQIGAEVGTVDPTRGIFDCSELAIVKRAATSTERTNMDNALKAKWGP